MKWLTLTASGEQLNSFTALLNDDPCQADGGVSASILAACGYP